MALIPARAGSKRVPGKNHRLLGDQPLVGWSIAAAAASKRIDHIILSTDDPLLIEHYRGDERVSVLVRPKRLCDDHAGSVDVALHALETERAAGRSWDRLVLLQPTSPFRAAGRIDAALGLLDKTAGGSVTSISRAQIHPYYCFFVGEDDQLQPVTGKLELGGMRSQDMPDAYRLTGSIYAIEVEQLSASRRFISDSTHGLHCDEPGEDIDIDTLEDFSAAEAFAAARFACDD